MSYATGIKVLSFPSLLGQATRLTGANVPPVSKLTEKAKHYGRQHCRYEVYILEAVNSLYLKRELYHLFYKLHPWWAYVLPKQRNH